LRRRRLRWHRSRGCCWSLPISCRGCWLRRHPRGRGGLDRRRRALVGHRWRIRLLDHVRRWSVVNGHVSRLWLRTAADKYRNSRERRARRPFFAGHEIKVLHIQSIRRCQGVPRWAKMQENAAAPCNLSGGLAVYAPPCTGARIPGCYFQRGLAGKSEARSPKAENTTPLAAHAAN
jgi:hypothetical protein